MKIHNFLDCKESFMSLELINKYTDGISLCLEPIEKLWLGINTDLFDVYIVLNILPIVAIPNKI